MILFGMYGAYIFIGLFLGFLFLVSTGGICFLHSAFVAVSHISVKGYMNTIRRVKA